MSIVTSPQSPVTTLGHYINTILEYLILSILNCINLIIDSRSIIIEKANTLVLPILDIIEELKTSITGGVRQGVVVYGLGYIIIFTPGGMREKLVSIVVFLMSMGYLGMLD